MAVWTTGVRLIALKPYSSTAVSMGALYEGSRENFGVAFGVSSIEDPNPGLALCSAKKAARVVMVKCINQGSTEKRWWTRMPDGWRRRCFEDVQSLYCASYDAGRHWAL